MPKQNLGSLFALTLIGLTFGGCARAACTISADERVVLPAGTELPVRVLSNGLAETAERREFVAAVCPDGRTGTFFHDARLRGTKISRDDWYSNELWLRSPEGAEELRTIDGYVLLPQPENFRGIKTAHPCGAHVGDAGVLRLTQPFEIGSAAPMKR